MIQLIPCPGCNRHVRQSESSCPFCSAALSLADVPQPLLPRSRLGRAATFAFGATIAGATVLVGCGGSSEEGGGESDAGESAGGSTVGPVYGAPAGGTPSTGGTSNGGTPSTGGTDATGGRPNTGGNSNVGGSAGPVYGSPPNGGSQNIGGTNGVPLYGAAPAD